MRDSKLIKTPSTLQADSSRLRVLLITARADIGGGPRHVFDLGAQLKASPISNVEVFIASPDEEPYGTHFKKLAQDFFILPKRRFSFLSFVSLLLFCRRNQIQLIHSHGRGAGSYSRLLKFFGYKIVHSFHGLHFKNGLRGTLILRAEQILSLWTDRLIAVSKGERKRALDLGIGTAGKLRLIYNGLGPLEKPPSQREEFGSASALVFGTLTRFDLQKGNDLLLLNISKLPKKVLSKTRFLIAGEGPEESNLRSLIQKLNLENNVLLIGPVSDPNLFLEKIDVFVSNSKGEGLSYATLEALRSHRPLLLSDVTGHDELKGIPGVLFFGLEAPTVFADEVSKFLTPPLLKTELPGQFTLDEMGRDIKSVYHELFARTLHQEQSKK